LACYGSSGQATDELPALAFYCPDCAAPDLDGASRL
jgi:hypothetical protein